MKVDKVFLTKVVLQAGDILVRLYQDKKIISSKAHRDILTEADIASDRFITEALASRYPEVPVLSEETIGSPEVQTCEYRFVLDPLDGTINFSRGIDEFGVSLAFQKNKRTLVGIVYKPVLNEWFIGEQGKGSTYNKKPLHIHGAASLAEAVVTVDLSRKLPTAPAYLDKLHERVRVVRSYGCAIHALGLLARGALDAYLFETPNIWDFAAMECIIEEAGGLFLDHTGKPWQEGAPLLVCTKTIEKDIVHILKESRL